MTLTVLQVADPFARVSRGAAGGAEQIISLIDEALVHAGYASIVMAARDSAVVGQLVPTEGSNHRAAIEAVLADENVDLIHFHGATFADYAPARSSIPEAVTLHLPPSRYPAPVFSRGDLHLICVSETERAAAPRCDYLIPNGIDLDAYSPLEEIGDYFVAIGRVCEEKNLHAAALAAKRAGARLVIAGETVAEDQRYYRDTFLPALDERRRFIGSVRMPAKRDLIARAKGTLIPSLVEANSSLVAMESLACGTPVIAWASGALPEIVEDGHTGILVSSVDEMAHALTRIDAIDRRECRGVAERRFDATAMTARYIDVYQRITTMAACVN